ncbi:MAG: hypothetical protein C0508_01585 [Cyanobacteria bacterium PR.023]|nr:hypothetical protein [Cyanobacteria bacterium PR.023]
MGALALILATASSFVSTPANANPIRTVQIGGVTCGEFNRSPTIFPKTYWDCITPNATGNPAAYSAAIAASGLATNIKTVLTAQNAQIFLFATKADYTAFTGGSGGVSPMGAIHTMTLPAPTGLSQIAAIYATNTVQTVPTNFSSYYAGNILQQLGRIYGANATLNSPQGDGTRFSGTFFQSALNDDRTYLSNTTSVDKTDYPSSATVWGSTIASMPVNVGKSPWEILGLRYGNTPELVYAYQFARQAANATLPDLNTVLQPYMLSTRSWSSQQVYLVNQQNYILGNTTGVATEAVLCVETNGANIYPLKWWSCVRPYNPTTAAQAVKTYPNTLPSAWQTLLKNANINVFAVRNTLEFDHFDGRSPGFYTGILGFSVYSTPKRSAAYQENFTSELHTTIKDEPQYMSGTILHELGHQLDVYWTRPSYANSAAVLGSVRWQTAITADKTAFNTGTCAAKVDQDRISNSLPAVCGLPANAGKSNWDVMTLTLYGYVDTDPNAAHVQAIKVELWARAFGRRAGGVTPQYAVDVQNRMSNQHTYMNDLWSTGAPHN